MKLQADTISQASDVQLAYDSTVYEHQLQQAQQFVNENSKADVSRLRDLLRKIMPVEYHAAIDEIKEAKPIQGFEIYGGNNQISPRAKVGILNRLSNNYKIGCLV